MGGSGFKVSTVMLRCLGLGFRVCYYYYSTTTTTTTTALESLSINAIRAVLLTASYNLIAAKTQTLSKNTPKA